MEDNRDDENVMVKVTTTMFISDLRKRNLDEATLAEVSAGDEDRNALHFVAIIPANLRKLGKKVVACVSFMPSTHDDEPCWELYSLVVNQDYAGPLVEEGTLSLLTKVPIAMVGQLQLPGLFITNAQRKDILAFERCGWTRTGEKSNHPTEMREKMVLRIPER